MVVTHSFSVVKQAKSYLNCLILDVSTVHTIRHTHTPTWTLLNKSSTRRRGHYLTNTHKEMRRKSMSSVGFEPTIPAIERAQAYALSLFSTSGAVVRCCR